MERLPLKLLRNDDGEESSSYIEISRGKENSFEEMYHGQKIRVI